jgi:hypothetical protein
MRENVIEWIDGDNTISVTLYQKRYVNKVRRLANTDNRVQILAENSDGSIFAHLPLEMLKLTQKRRTELTDERREELAERMRNMPRSKNDPTPKQNEE